MPELAKRWLQYTHCYIIFFEKSIVRLPSFLRAHASSTVSHQTVSSDFARATAKLPWRWQQPCAKIKSWRGHIAALCWRRHPSEARCGSYYAGLLNLKMKTIENLNLNLTMMKITDNSFSVFSKSFMMKTTWKMYSQCFPSDWMPAAFLLLVVPHPTLGILFCR